MIVQLLPKLIFNPNYVTRGNNYRLFKHRCHYDLRKFSFTNRIVNIWNLPNTVVEVDTVDKFKLSTTRGRAVCPGPAATGPCHSRTADTELATGASTYHV